MKVCMITSSYPRYPGDGAGSFVASLARALAADGCAITVVAPHDPAVSSAEPASASMDGGLVLVKRFRYAPRDAMHVAGHGRALQGDQRMRWLAPLLMPGYIAAAIACTMDMHRREQFDLIHGHWAIPMGAIAGLVGRLLSRPLIVSLHGSDVYVAERSRPYAAAARYGFRRANRVTACSVDLSLRAQRVGLAAEKSIVIPYGVDATRYVSGARARIRQQLGIPESLRVIGALGRLVHKKGFRYLIAAMPRILRTERDACCVIGGSGDLQDELACQAKRLGIADRVLFPGHIDWRNTPDYYAMCDMFVVPSVVDAHGNVDGLPNVLLEAMATGCAVVATSVGGIPDVVTDGQNGLLVRPGDAHALAESATRLLRDASLRHRLGSAAQRGMQEQHSWRDVAARFRSLYEAALAAHGEARS